MDFPKELTEDDLSLRIKEWPLLGYVVMARDAWDADMYEISDLQPQAVAVILLLVVSNGERHPAVRYDKYLNGTWSKVYGATQYSP